MSIYYKLGFVIPLLIVGCSTIDTSQLDEAIALSMRHHHELNTIKEFIVSNIQDNDNKDKLLIMMDAVITSGREILDILYKLRKNVETSTLPTAVQVEIVRLITTAIQEYKH